LALVKFDGFGCVSETLGKRKARGRRGLVRHET